MVNASTMAVHQAGPVHRERSARRGGPGVAEVKAGGGSGGGGCCGSCALAAASVPDSTMPQRTSSPGGVLASQAGAAC